MKPISPLVADAIGRAIQSALLSAALVVGLGSAVLPGLAGASPGCEAMPKLEPSRILAGDRALIERVAGRRQLRLRIPRRVGNRGIAEAIRLCKGRRPVLATPVINPLDKSIERRPVGLAAIEAADNEIVMVVNGPVARGATLTLPARTLAVGGRSNRSGQITLAGIDPAEATFWYKALEPSDAGQDLLGLASYPRARGLVPGRPQPSGHGDVLAELRDHFKRMIKAGFLSHRRADQLIALLQRSLAGNAPRIAAVFQNPAGHIEARLLAATLANAGTVMDGVIETILRGADRSNRPIRVYFARPGDVRRQTRRNLSAFVRVGADLSIVFADEARKMPLPILASLLGHEALHQDTLSGLPEEMIASLAQFIAYAQHVLAEPALTRWGTDAVRSSNIRLVTMINSGAARYPNPGLRASLVMQPDGNVFPRSRTNWLSLEDLLRRRTYRFVRNVPTPGNRLLDSIMTRMSGKPHKGHAFSAATIDRLERMQALSWAQWVDLAHILRLRLPVEPPSSRQRGHGHAKRSFGPQ